MSELPQPQPSTTYRLLRGGFRTLFSLLTRLDIQGMERTPLEGPLIITTNHTTLLEAPLYLAFTPRVPISALAKKEWQDSFIGNFIMDHVDPVYIDRGEMDRKALTTLIKRLKAGEAFGIAPEGTRSKDGTLLEAKEGVAYMASRTNAQILPMAVWGHTEMMRDYKRFRRPTIHVRIGEPYRLETDPELSRQENLAAQTELIMSKIARMLPPEYRGYYAYTVDDSAPEPYTALP